MFYHNYIYIYSVILLYIYIILYHYLSIFHSIECWEGCRIQTSTPGKMMYNVSFPTQIHRLSCAHALRGGWIFLGSRLGNLGIIPGLFENRPLSVFVHLRYSNLHRITKIQNDPNVEISSSVLIKSRTPGSKAWLGRGDFHCAFMAFGNLARRRGLKPAGSYGVAGHAYPLHPLTNNHAKWIIMNYSKCNLNNHQKSPK